MNRAAIGLGVLLLAATSCSDSRPQRANGTITGRVISTAPVAGAQVLVWWHGPAGDLASPDPMGETVTEEDGSFYVEFGPARGQLIVEVLGGRTTDLVTGESVVLAEDARLASFVFTQASEDHEVVVTPVTTMAESLAWARFAGGKHEDIWGAFERAAELIGAHFGNIDASTTIPADATTGAGGLSAEVRYGLVLSGLSWLANSIAEGSDLAPTSFNVLHLTEALAADLGSAEALFDGMDANGPLSVGQCPEPEVCRDEACTTICDLDANTVRGDLSGAARAFLKSDLNATGLDGMDTGAMLTQIATNPEPELFGDAPIEGDGSSLTLSQADFYIDDTGIWWSRDDGPFLTGTVEPPEGASPDVRVQVNQGEWIQAEILDDIYWVVRLEPGTLAGLPTTNTVTVTATDPTGQQTVILEEMRVDSTAASVEFSTTVVADEREDDISFDSNSVPSHVHSGPAVQLGGSGCPDVYKHAYLLTPDDSNPLKFKFRVTDAESGVDTGTVRYRIVKQSNGSVLVDWTSPDAGTPVTAGREYELLLTRDALPALESLETELKIEIQARDQLGQADTRSACWDHHPLAAPLHLLTSSVKRVVSPPDGLNEFGFTGSTEDISPLLNGTTWVDGAGVVEFELRNGTSEAVAVTLDWSHAPATYSKTWQYGSALVATQQVTISCPAGSNTPECSSQQPPADVPYPGGGEISSAIDGVRVWDRGSGQELASCGNCWPNEFQLAPRHSDGAPRRYRVILVVASLPELAPDSSVGGGPYSRFDVAGVTVTGKSLGIVKRCAQFQEFPGGVFCRRVDSHRVYRALLAASLEYPSISAALRTRPSVAVSRYAPAGPREVFILSVGWSPDDAPSPP